MSYCLWAKKRSRYRESIGEFFWVSLFIIKRILSLHSNKNKIIFTKKIPSQLQTATGFFFLWLLLVFWVEKKSWRIQTLVGEGNIFVFWVKKRSWRLKNRDVGRWRKEKIIYGNGKKRVNEEKKGKKNKKCAEWDSCL